MGLDVLTFEGLPRTDAEATVETTKTNVVFIFFVILHIFIGLSCY